MLWGRGAATENRHQIIVYQWKLVAIPQELEYKMFRPICSPRI